VSGLSVVAVEPSGEVIEVAKEYFGLGGTPVRIVEGFGEEYLTDPGRCGGDGEGKTHVLIVDAEDGDAPPAIMRTGEFWSGVARDALHDDAVVGVNFIGDFSEREEFVATLQLAFRSHKVVVCSVPKVANVSERHCLVFVVPGPGATESKFGNGVEMFVRGKGFVEDEDAWLECVRAMLE
jgi:spermidine synthase